MVDHDEIRCELRSLFSATRTLIEFHRDAGTMGLPENPPETWPPQVSDLLSLSIPSISPPVQSVSPSSIPPDSMESPDTVRTPPPFGITDLPPAVSSEVSITEEPPLVLVEPAASLPPVTLQPSVPAPQPSPPLFEAEPVQAALFTASEIPETRTPLPVRAADLPSPHTVEAHQRLEILAQQIQSCARCELYLSRTQTVFARGNPDAEICFIGDAPGAEEDEQGVPFVGRAGQLLDRMIAAMGLRQEEVYLLNLCRCRPPADRTPKMEEMAACLPYLHEQLALVHPRVIVALGATATKGLFETSIGIKALRGKWKLYRGAIPVMPTYHPAFILKEIEAGRNDARRDVWKDLQVVLERLGRPIPSRGKK